MSFSRMCFRIARSMSCFDFSDSVTIKSIPLTKLLGKQSDDELGHALPRLDAVELRFFVEPSRDEETDFLEFHLVRLMLPPFA